MKECNLCQGRGVRPIGLENHALCTCVVFELAALRAALVDNGLLPGDHWTRQPRGVRSDEPLHLVLSTRRDGYRLIRGESGAVEARAPNGRICWLVPGETSLAQLERDLDREYPLEEDH